VSIVRKKPISLSSLPMTTRSTTALLLEALPEPHCFINRQLECLGANAAFARLVGATAADIEGRLITDFWPDAHRMRWETREFSAEFRPLAGASVLVKLATFAGELLLIRVLASFSDDDSGKVFHDQRLETLGILAGAVAHDFNNILTGILGHYAYLQHVLPQEGAHVESLKAVEEGALRASSLSQQILQFSRAETESLGAKVDLGEVVSRVCVLLKSAIPSQIRLRYEPPARSVSVIGSEAQLSQVIINLVVNARDAISGQGEVAITIDRACASDEVSRLFGTEPAASAYCAFVVRDTGEGMDDETRARLFEPYFTTKGAKGTGLGLATVNAIVKKLGGAIEVDSERGRGTEFRVVLPLVDERSSEGDHSGGRGAQIQDDGPLAGYGERILVVDDEYAVRNVLGLSLSHLGYTVETAGSGLEALEKYKAANHGFALVILDMLMPGMSGEEVFNRLKQLNSCVRVLLVSGFSSEEVVHRILAQGGRDFIQKPFAIDVLSRKVRGCLEQE
jgi:two-component system cell cycle sensor histidine kinase/response regulator CckA